MNLDEQGRLHSLTEAAVAYPDGWSLYAVHGVNVPEDLIKNKSSITIQMIEKEENAEIRRVMIELYGQARYLLDSGAKKIHEDEWGTLYRKDLSNDEPIVMVKVVNSTRESDGSFKDYFLRCHPELRPLKADGLGEPQRLTGLNAVASTFGLKGSEYLLQVQT